MRAEFELLTKALEKKEERNIERLTQSLETTLKQIEMRKKATNAETYLYIP